MSCLETSLALMKSLQRALLHSNRCAVTCSPKIALVICLPENHVVGIVISDAWVLLTRLIHSQYGQAIPDTTRGISRRLDLAHLHSQNSGMNVFTSVSYNNNHNLLPSIFTPNDRDSAQTHHRVRLQSPCTTRLTGAELSYIAHYAI